MVFYPSNMLFDLAYPRNGLVKLRCIFNHLLVLFFDSDRKGRDLRRCKWVAIRGSTGYPTRGLDKGVNP